MVVEREVSYMQENCKHVKDTSLGVGVQLGCLLNQ